MRWIEIEQWIADPAPLTLRSVSQPVDVENLRRYFLSLFSEVMNRRHDEPFLSSQLEHYRQLAVSAELRPLDFFDSIDTLFRHRKAVLRDQMTTYLGAPTFHHVRVADTGNRPLLIDGWPEVTP